MSPTDAEFEAIEQQLAEIKGRVASTRALCATLVPPPPPIVRRFRPGHYMRVGALTPLESALAQLKALKHGFIGFQLEVYWGEVEPELNRYDFRRIKQAIEFCETHGFALWIWIQRKQFNPGSAGPMPVDLGVPIKIHSDGVMAAPIWLPTVCDRYMRFLDTLRPIVEAAQCVTIVSNSESAPGNQGIVSMTWAPALISEIAALAEWKHVTTATTVNWFGSAEPLLLDEAQARGVIHASGDAQDTNGSRARPKGMQHVAVATLLSLKTHGSLEAQLAWAKANNVEALAWYVQSGLPFASPEQIADFCAGNPLQGI